MFDSGVPAICVRVAAASRGTPACWWHRVGQSDVCLGAPDGRQYASRHGQGRSEEADREHEVPGVDGALAAVEEHRRVSTTDAQTIRISV